MLRILVPAVIACALTFPAAANDFDAKLASIMDRDGPTVTHDIDNDGDSDPAEDSSTPASACDQDNVLPECGWVITGSVDFKDGEGPTPAYWNLEMGAVPDEQTDEEAMGPEMTLDETRAQVEAILASGAIDMSGAGDNTED